MAFYGGWGPYVPVGGTAPQGDARDGEAQEEGPCRSRRSWWKAGRSRRPSGANRGAKIWSGTAITRTACRAGGLMCATGRWSICR